jgi:hypothetical protein
MSESKDYSPWRRSRGRMPLADDRKIECPVCKKMIRFIYRSNHACAKQDLADLIRSMQIQND